MVLEQMPTVVHQVWISTNYKVSLYSIDPGIVT